MATELATIYVMIRASTDQAILVAHGGYGPDVWIPKSQIHADSEVFGDEPEDGELVIPQWLAEKKGLV